MQAPNRRLTRRAFAVLVVALPLAYSASASQAPRFGLAATAEIALNDPGSTPETNSATLTSDRFTLVAQSVDVPLGCGDDTIFENGFD